MIFIVQLLARAGSPVELPTRGDAIGSNRATVRAQRRTIRAQRWIRNEGCIGGVPLHRKYVSIWAGHKLSPNRARGRIPNGPGAQLRKAQIA